MTMQTGHRIGRTAAAIALLTALAAPAAGGDRPEFKRDFAKDVALAPGQTLAIEHAHGDITIVTHKEKELRIRAAIRVSSSDVEGAEEFSKGIAIDVEPSAAGVLLKTRYPKKEWVFKGRGYISYSVDYEIAMPQGAALDARNKFGNVAITGLEGSASIRTGNGAVTIRQSKGPLVLETVFGGVEITGHDGQAQVSVSNGPLSISTLRGDLDARTRFGRLAARGVTGKARVSGSGGAVEFEDCGGVDITNSFGDVRLRGIRGDVLVRNANGGVVVSGVAGSADLGTSFGSIEFTDVKKKVSVTGSNAKIAGSRTGEPVTVANTFGAVEIREVPGIEVVNSNGKVMVRDIRGPASLTTSFSSIDAMGIGGKAFAANNNGAVTLVDVGGSAEVRTRFGKVHASRIRGPLTVESENGHVVAADVDGKADLKTSFAGIEVARVAGSLDAENTNGGVKALNVRGAATVRTSFGPVLIQDVEGAVDVANKNGSIEITRLPARCAAVSLRTSFAPIRVEVSERGSYRVEARTSFGRISSPFPFVSEASSRVDAVSGSIGGGDCAMSLTNSNGNIQIDKGH
jgi:DUF4097 and DUF4098 domain-containing protein YvlB